MLTQISHSSMIKHKILRIRTESLHASPKNFNIRGAVSDVELDLLFETNAVSFPTLNDESDVPEKCIDNCD